MQLYLFFADDAIGKYSQNELYDYALRFAPDAGIGVIHDWYTLNKSNVNSLVKLNLEKSRLKIPFLHTGECLHGVGSFQQSMFPQAQTLSMTWDEELIRSVGRAIGTEARAIGIHACFAPVLDICRDSRWGRCQEGWGEDHILTTHLGVAFASGLSKNGTWGDQDAVVPVMKHFAAHGAAQGGMNTAPWMGRGMREVMMNLFMPFKAAVELGGVRGVMMAYSELDEVPCSVNPVLYSSLDEWGYDGFVIADDTGMSELQYVHEVSASQNDTIGQWFNAGGMVSFYDYHLDVYMNATLGLVQNGTLSLDTLKRKMRRILGVKYDLGLFENPYIPDDIDAEALTEQNIPLTLEAAQKSIVLLENHNHSLPLSSTDSGIKKLALIGPYSDMLNFGDYSGQFGQYPIERASTIRQGILEHFQETGSHIELMTAWGTNTWLYNGQYPIPGYHLWSTDGAQSGLSATYYADMDFSKPVVQKLEVPARDWGLYPPSGLSSNNFSATWEGQFDSPVSVPTNGWLGVAISWNATAKLYVDGKLHVNVPMTKNGNFLSNIPSRTYSVLNSTDPPPGSAAFTFLPGAKHTVRLEFQSWNFYQKLQNMNSLNAQVLLFWNLVDATTTTSSSSSAISQAVQVAQQADTILLTLGASWDSDGENGDRATFGLSANQTALARAIYALNKPTILVLSGGGRPFAIPEFYNASSAVLATGFLGQSAGRAVADVLFGEYNPGGRLTLSVPLFEAQSPVFYNYKPTAHLAQYVDFDSNPAYPFGYGKSYSEFELSGFDGGIVGSVGSSNNNNNNSKTFGASDHIEFHVTVHNKGPWPGSYVPQVYLLQRVSQIVQPLKQLVAFTRVYLAVGETRNVTMALDVQRYLRILNRNYAWEVERGDYTFALLPDGGVFADAGVNVTLTCP
ncbi:glycoside hydrolase family 3 protein [Cercospora zeae-maydis SCOH1-5]|uniref:xylan 1,4-beta-xylosidase n=1 Tax=Cercospora zeae-maydis SCOH1-5 TaxID=717836 RepID=A0A6A6F7B0_9PEZI|nr:glycoside hydrolase family 3 protein [Cercospora zeae-maydis SCOH1-5]